MRSLTLVLRSSSVCFKVFQPNLAPIYSLRSTTEHSEDSRPRRPTKSVWHDLCGHRLISDLQSEYRCIPLVGAARSFFVSKL